MSGTRERIGRQLSRTIVMLVILQVLTSVAGAWLLGRMTPAIARILDENERSVEAVEEMLLALGSDVDDERRRADFDAALSRAEANVTEDEEPAVLGHLRRQLDAAISGEPAARREVLTSLGRLAEINREAMHRADAEAQRLGLAGAWAVSLLGLLGLLASVYTAQRMRRRFVGPLELLADVVDDHARGASHRRCPRGEEGELSDVLQQVNGLLDRLEAVPAPSATVPAEVAVQRLLDRLGAAVIINPAKQIVAASQRALDHLSDAPGFREELVSLATGEATNAMADARVERLADGSWLIDWRAESREDTTEEADGSMESDDA